MAKYDSLIAARFEVVRVQGDERICRCPFHDDTGNPNLSVNAETGLYRCFSCSAKGSLKGIAGVSRDLAGMRKRLYAPSKEAVKVYPENWLRQFDNETDYWRDRGYSDRVIKLFRLGYDPVTDCPTIPVRSSRGEVLGVIRRQLPPIRPKYLHPKGFKTGRDLFGSWLVRQRHYNRVAIVEGPADAIACWDVRVPALAMHGAHLTEDQAKILRGLGATTVVCMTDNDRAGDEATHTIKAALPGLAVLVGWYRPHWQGKDPAELHPIRRRQMFSEALHYSKAFRGV